MKQVTIAIGRGKVMGVVEGISVIISHKNGGTPSFEQLWASEDERAKLDIYYREAVSDLERRLMEWLSSSSSQYDLEAAGTDYTLTLRMHQYWPARLEGLLKNKVQDYLVHSITAGWLNDFDGVTTKQDYSGMAGNDLADIREIVMQKEFGFGEDARSGDTESKDEEAAGASTSARSGDTESKDEDVNDVRTKQRRSDGEHKNVEQRTDTSRRLEDGIKEESESTTEAGARSDDADKEQTESTTEAGARSDDADKSEPQHTTEASKRRSDYFKSDADTNDMRTRQRSEDGEHKNGQRQTDTHLRTADKEKAVSESTTDAQERREDGEYFPDEEQSFEAGARHEDNARVCHRRDWTDWSSTHFNDRRFRR